MAGPRGALLLVRKPAQLAPARGIERREALGEVRERDVAELIDQSTHLGVGSLLAILVPRQPRRVGVVTAGSRAVEQALVCQPPSCRSYRRAAVWPSD